MKVIRKDLLPATLFRECISLQERIVTESRKQVTYALDSDCYPTYVFAGIAADPMKIVVTLSHVHSVIRCAVQIGFVAFLSA